MCVNNEPIIIFVKHKYKELADNTRLPSHTFWHEPATFFSTVVLIRKKCNAPLSKVDFLLGGLHTQPYSQKYL